MPATSPREATPTRLTPPWRALGVQDTKHGKRYWLQIGERVRGYRASELYGLSFLTDIYPDVEHWRRTFPYGVGRRIDTGRAMSYFIGECERAGEYQPDPHLDAKSSSQ